MQLAQVQVAGICNSHAHRGLANMIILAPQLASATAGTALRLPGVLILACIEYRRLIYAGPLYIHITQYAVTKPSANSLRIDSDLAIGWCVYIPAERLLHIHVYQICYKPL